MPRIEFYRIVLVVAAAMMLLAQSNHFVMLFVALETVTVGLYILVSYCRTSAPDARGGPEVPRSWAPSARRCCSSGSSLLYGVAGNPALPGHTGCGLHYADLARFPRRQSRTISWRRVGIVLVLAGVAFKIGAFPFQIWIPDVYQGAPTPVTAFLAVASKAAGFAVLLGLVRFVFPAYGWLVDAGPFGSWPAATILFGNLAALTQHNVKRLIGLSGVSHAGFLLLGVVAAASVAARDRARSISTCFAYLLASFAVFGVMAHLAGSGRRRPGARALRGPGEGESVSRRGAGGRAGLAGRHPAAGGLRGQVPDLRGGLSGAGSTGLLASRSAGVVVSIYYYFGWIKAAYFDGARPATELTPRPARTPVGWGARCAMLGLALASIVIGFCPGGFAHWLRW